MRLSEYAGSIADDIEEHGHFQETETSAGLWSPDEPELPCCLIANPTNERLRVESFRRAERGEAQDLTGTWYAMGARLAEAIGCPARSWLVDWSNTNHTADVIEKLREIQAADID